ncbi:MAG: PTS galactitol transporter subunit IIB [Firmicutes bacterium]|nr:PTS galactitol transporter subunit IIB [Bacillota bacterium]
MNKKRILVVCPTAAATSTLIAQKLRELCEREGVAAEIKICATIEVASTVAAFSPDLIVSSSGLLPGTAGGVPSLNGLPFLTGMGVNDLERKVVGILSGNQIG